MTCIWAIYSAYTHISELHTWEHCYSRHIIFLSLVCSLVQCQMWHSGVWLPSAEQNKMLNMASEPLNRFKLNINTGSEFRVEEFGTRESSGAKRSLLGQDILHPRQCYGKPAHRCLWVSHHCHEESAGMSSFTTCTDIWGFKQVLKENLVRWEKIVQVNVTDLLQEKVAAKKGCPPSLLPLERARKQRENITYVHRRCC